MTSTSLGSALLGSLAPLGARLASTLARSQPSVRQRARAASRLTVESAEMIDLAIAEAGWTAREKRAMRGGGKIRHGFIVQTTGNSGLASLDDEVNDAWVALSPEAFGECEDCVEIGRKHSGEALVYFRTAADMEYVVCVDHLDEDEFCRWTLVDPQTEEEQS